LAAAIRDPDPVVFFEHKSLLANKGEVPDGEHVEPLGKAKVLRSGGDATIIALAAMVPRAEKAAEALAAEGINATVIGVRSRVPLDAKTMLAESARTGRVFTVEENPRLCGWGAEITSVIQEEIFSSLKGPVVRITTPHVPLPSADQLEDAVIPTVARIVAEVKRAFSRRCGRSDGGDHAAAGRNGDRGDGRQLVQEGRRHREGRRAALRRRDRQGHDRDSFDRFGGGEGHPGRGRPDRAGRN